MSHFDQITLCDQSNASTVLTPIFAKSFTDADVIERDRNLWSKNMTIYKKSVIIAGTEIEKYINVSDLPLENRIEGYEWNNDVDITVESKKDSKHYEAVRSFVGCIDFLHSVESIMRHKVSSLVGLLISIKKMDTTEHFNYGISKMKYSTFFRDIGKNFY
jgi:hypothetical protein